MGITKCDADRTSHGNRTKGELVILVVPPSGAGKTFRCSIDRKKFNGESLHEALEVVKGYINHEYGWTNAGQEG